MSIEINNIRCQCCKEILVEEDDVISDDHGVFISCPNKIDNGDLHTSYYYNKKTKELY